MNSFNTQIALVTGASSGIGKAIALRLADQGATVCLAARRFEELEEIASQYNAAGKQLRPYKLDITREHEAKELADRLKADFGHIDIVVHSAGTFAAGPLAHAPIADFDDQWRTNVLGPYILTQKLLPLVPPRHGQFVFINSTVGLTAREGVSQYAATKHALTALADSLREEINRTGIRVLSLYLGRTATPLQAKVAALEQKPYQPENLIQADDVAAVVVSALGLPRTVEVTDIRMRPLLPPKL